MSIALKRGLLDSLSYYPQLLSENAHLQTSLSSRAEIIHEVRRAGRSKPKFMERFSALDNRLFTLYRFKIPYDAKILLDDARSPTNTKPTNNELLDVGATCLLREEYANLVRMAREIDPQNQHGYVEKMEEYIDFERFHMLSTLTMRFGAISLGDFIDGATKPSLRDSLYFFVSVWNILQALARPQEPSLFRHYAQIIEANLKIFDQRRYPLETELKMDAAARAIVILTNIDNELQDQPRKDPLEQAAIGKVRVIVSNIRKTQEAIGRRILDPDARSQDYEDLIAEMSTYLDDENLWQRALRLSDLLSITNIRSTYRRILFLAENGIHTDFYKKLAGRIKEYVLSINIDDFPLFVTEFEDEHGVGSLPQSTSAPSYQELNEQSRRVAQATPARNFKLEDSKEINWQSLRQPDEVEIDFDPHNPASRFTIHLVWNVNEDERKELSFKIDTKKNYFDWSFLDSPDDQEITPYKLYLLTATHQILAILNELIRTKQIISNSHQVSAETESIKKGAMTAATREFYESKRIARKRQIQSAKSNNQLVERDTPIPRRIKGKIIFNRKEVHEIAVAKNIPLSDEDLILKKLSNINVGNRFIVPIETQPGYFRVRAGNWRVILIQNNNNQYYIDDIKRRGEDTYKI